MLIREITEHELDHLRLYAHSVIDGGGVEAVYLIGSSVKHDDYNDVDILYQLALKGRNTAEAVEELIEQTAIDLDAFDSFFQAGESYFHLSSGAGRELVDNDAYAADKVREPKILLAAR